MVAIISAMRSEIESLRALLTGEEYVCISGCDIWRGRLYGKDVLCAVCGEGKVNAALCAQAVIMTYHPDAVINVGVGGGIASFLNVGDVVVADRVVQHDFDVSALGYKRGQLCNFDDVYIPCDIALCSALFSAAKKTMAGSEFHAYKGVVATGDCFVSDSIRARDISDAFGAYVVEMEGASIGQVCALNDTPFCVVRAVSDSGSDSAFQDFRTFLEHAVNQSLALIGAYFKN